MKHLFYSLVVITASLPITSSADTYDVVGGQQPNPTTDPVSLTNPLRIGSLNELFVALLKVFIIIATPIIVFFIILAGFKYVTARGNATQVEEATRALTYAIIGGVLILGSVVLIEIISNVVGEFAAP